MRVLELVGKAQHAIEMLVGWQHMRPTWATPLSMTFGTGANADGRAHSRPMAIILTIIWLASVTCVFVLIGIIGSHAGRALTPAHQH